MTPILLAIDAGNTTTTAALLQTDGCILRHERRPTAELSAETAAGLLDALGRDLPPGAPSRIGLASVVPEAEAVLAAALGAWHKSAVLRLRSGETPILPHRLATPETTGVDRLLAARAALDLPRPPGTGRIVVQVGTAVTVDAVASDGVFLGGLILPGPALWLSGLGRAARLPDLSSPDGSPSAIPWGDARAGDRTREALLHGLAAGLPGAVDGAIRAAASSVPGPCLPVLTGGAAEAVAPHLAHRAPVYPDLVLQGIRLVLLGAR